MFLDWRKRKMSKLLQLLENIESAFGVRICVHDISGITYTVQSLELPYVWKSHSGKYCSDVKRCTSERECMRQKQISLRVLQKNGLKPYCGICRMGVCDYVEPVVLDGRLLAVVFASGMIENWAETARRRMEKHLPKNEEARDKLGSFFSDFAMNSRSRQEQLQFFAELVHADIVREVQNRTYRIPIPREQYPVEAIRKWRTGIAPALLSFLEENFRNDLNLRILAQHFLLSEGHINRLIREEVHMGAMAYVKHLRLEEAARELKETDLPIREIGESVGYADVNYFCRVFKQVYGITPTTYRKQII